MCSLGALKITPFHDALDWEIASRHSEEILGHDQTAFSKSCIDDLGRLTEEAREFTGLDRFDARLKVPFFCYALQETCKCEHLLLGHREAGLSRAVCGCTETPGQPKLMQ